MKRLKSDRFVTQLSKDDPPAYTVEDGETFVVETLDCRGGFVQRDGTLRPGGPAPNPVTGPIEVTGSRPGEAIAVTIHDVKTADWGFIGGGEGAQSIVVEIEDGIAIYPWGLRLPVSPIVGVVGLAPPGDAFSTMVPSGSGGNLDTVDVCAGATIYLPVAIPGGMLTIGDVHALQGDSECSGTGIECAAEVTLTVRRVEHPLWPSVYLVRDDKLMVFSHGETVDDAAWGAVASMAELLTKLTGLSDFESRGLLSTAGEVRISQIVNPKKTCRAVIPREAIPNHWPF